MEGVNIISEGYDERQQKLKDVHQRSYMDMNKDLEKRKSAFRIQNDDDHAFCGQTISIYDKRLRMICNICCIILVSTFTITAYSFFFRMTSTLSSLSGLNEMTFWNVMMLNARMGYLTNGVEERDLQKCRRKYQTSWWFLVDMFSVFPFFLFTSLVPNWLKRYNIISDGLKNKVKFQLTAIYRQKAYLRLHWILQYLKSREDEPGSSTLVFRGFKFLLLIFFTWFGLGCFWYFVACSREALGGFHLNQCVANSWMYHAPQEILTKVNVVVGQTNDTSVLEEISFDDNRLLNSLYWSMATASSTGYGDIRAYTMSEKVYSVCAMFIGMAIMYGMTIGGLTSLLTNIDARRSTFTQKYQAFKDEIKTLEVCDDIKRMCLRYYDYMWHKYEGQNVHTTGFLQVLPESLRARFYESCFRPLTGNADLFSQLEPAFNRNLARVSEPMVYLEDQFIEKSGKIGTQMTFLKSGMLEVLDNNEEHAIANLPPGKLFGQILLVFDLPRVSSIRCKTDCEVFVLNKHDFRMVLSEYPESARLFIQAAREKCIGGRSQEWPMTPPSEDFFNAFIDKSIQMRRMSTIANATNDRRTMRLDAQAKQSMETEARMRRPTFRRQSVVTSGYDEDLIRVQVKGVEDQIRPGTPGAVTRLMEDGTQLITDNANFADLSSSLNMQTVTRKETEPNSMTVINPEGRFLKYWQNYIFILSIFTGWYTLYMAFINTTPGKENAITSMGGNLPSDISGLTALVDNVKAHFSGCTTLNTFENFFACSQSTNQFQSSGTNLFSESMVTKIDSNYTITVPASYDTQYSPMTSAQAGSGWNIFLSYVIIDLSFYLNILINLRTGIKTPDGYLTSFRDIFQSYSVWDITKLVMDIVAVFPFEIFSPAVGSTPLVKAHAWVFLRLTRMFYFFRYVPAGFSRFEYSLDVNISHVRGLKVFVYLFFVTHVLACIFYFRACSYWMQSQLLDISYKCRVGSWAWNLDVNYDSSPGVDYVKTFYWATTTMSSTGYGDITSYTASGRVISMAVMLLGTFMYGWIIAVIASTVSNNEAAETSYTNKLEDTKRYLKIHDVPKALINRVMDVRYIEWQRYQGTAIPGEECIGADMGENFRTSLLYETVHDYIVKLPFFKGIDESFITTICTSAHTYHYSEGDIITYTGDLSRNLCIVRSGHADVVTEDLSTIVEHLKPGDYFGEIEVLFGCGSPRTVVADTCCEVIVLSREEIDNALKSYPLVAHHFSKIEQDENYKNSIINTMNKRSQQALEQRNEEKDMTRRYNTANVVDNVSIYSTRAVKEPFFQMRDGMPSFSSESTFYVYYEFCRVIAIVCTMVIVPLLFSVSSNSNQLWSLQYVFDFLCFGDQIVKGFTGYHNEKGVYVTKPYDTWLHYAKRSLVVDFLSWCPFELIVSASVGSVSAQQYRLVGLIRILRVLQMYKISGYINYFLHDIRTKQRWAFHLQTVILGLILHHWVACILFIVACPPSSSSVTDVGSTFISLNSSTIINIAANQSGDVCYSASWLGKIMSDSASFPSLDLVHSTLDQYAVSFYWGSATLIAVGYGDISAGSVPEMAIATLIMLVGTVFYSYIIGEISSNIQMADIRRGHFKARLSDILQFFKVYEISTQLKNQVYEHYCYMWDRTNGVSPNELLTGLPPAIKTSVCQSMYIDMIKEAFDIRSLDDFRNDKETLGFFRLVSTMIKPSLFLKDNIICRRGDAGEEMFFIQRGNVGLVMDDGCTSKVLGPGQHFGEVALLYTCNRTETVKALTNCDITVLSRKDLDEVLSKFPRFRSQLEKTAHDRKVKGVWSLTYNRTPSEAALGNGCTFDNNGIPINSGSQDLMNLMINRGSWLSLTWNQITILMGFLSACLTLLQISFNNHSYVLYILAGLTDIWFLCDMLISFHTTYLDKFSTNVDNLPRIHRHYFRSKTIFVISAFSLDALANLPLEILSLAFAPIPSMTILAGLRLNRVLRLHKVLSIFHFWENDIRRDALVARIYKFCLCGAFIINALSCFWFLMACPESICHKYSWANTDDTDYSARDVRGHNALPWVDGLYWAVATMTTTGYGDISPETQAEMFYSCIAMIIGKMFIGYVLGMVGATLANDESLRVWYEGNVNIVKSAMKDLNFPPKLSDHIIQYYNYMWLKNHGTNVMQLFPDLAFSLRADIYSEICGDLVKKIDLFEGCPPNFLRHVCTVMTPVSYMPGDYITIQGDIRSEMYVIRRGVAEAFVRDGYQKKSLRLVCEGEVFLPQSALCKVKRPCSLRCCPGTYVDVFVLTMDSLQEVLGYYPDIRGIILKNAKELYPNLEL